MHSSYRYSACTLIAALLLFSVTSMMGCKDNPVSSEAALSAVGTTGGSANAKDHNENGTIEPFADAEVFFEFNTTDNDLGLQIFLDAEGWRQVKVDDPSKHKILQIMAEGPLSELGITELRFESAEPSPAEVLDLFAPGEYTFTGKKVEGGKLLSSADLSHDFVYPTNLSPSDGEEVDPNNTTVTWQAPGAEKVEIIISDEEQGFDFDVIVPASVTSLDVPPQFLEPDTEYKIEILAIAPNGNKAIVESDFVTMP